MACKPVCHTEPRCAKRVSLCTWRSLDLMGRTQLSKVDFYLCLLSPKKQPAQRFRQRHVDGWLLSLELSGDQLDRLGFSSWSGFDWSLTGQVGVFSSIGAFGIAQRSWEAGDAKHLERSLDHIILYMIILDQFQFFAPGFEAKQGIHRCCM